MALSARISALLVVSTLMAALPSTKGASETQFCNKYVRENGYTCSEYQVLTDDGYYLTMQRLAPPSSPLPAPAAPQNGTSLPVGAASSPTSFNSSSSPGVQRPAVYLDHALFLGGDLWFRATEPSRQLPFILANNGFDVWVGNHRGTEYSSLHVNYTTEDFAYWDFCFDTMMAHDLPVMIDTIRQVTGEPKVHFVGYNQGAMLAVAAASSNSTFANTLASASLLGPIAYLVNITSPLLMQWGTSFSPDSIFYRLQLLNGVYNLTNTNMLTGFITGLGINPEQGDGVDQVLAGIVGPVCCVSNETLSNFANSLDPNWVVASYRNLIHYQQEMVARRFQYWDYGNNYTNEAQYGAQTPNQYTPMALPPSLPLFLLSGSSDAFADPLNMARLVGNLPAPPRQLVVAGYSHLDLVLSDTVVEDVFTPVMEFLSSVLAQL